MMYLPSERIRAYSREVHEWMYMDMNDYTLKLREDAPNDIRKKREIVLKDYEDHIMFEV